MRVENNHGRLEQLKNIGFPLLLPMELLLLEEKRRKLRFQNSQRKAQVALNWPKKDEKGYLKSKSKEDGEVRSVGHILLCSKISSGNS